jgi:hypothetical protein
VIAPGSEDVLWLPLALKPNGGVIAAIGTEATRATWKQTWGMYVDGSQPLDGKKFWWDRPEIVQECINFDTTWSITTLVATKPR